MFEKVVLLFFQKRSYKIQLTSNPSSQKRSVLYYLYTPFTLWH